ncbi:Rrf2 family transcriptional regulator [Acinetobacter gandensis]|uniref:Transcriptional regulator n=1 Tax=Acinetobacter gandensis TaxID=1443941 RepID=A0A1A7RC89_9GAMM|nr:MULTISPECIES: Rrf2 family transcriptional regulator [Acinetobacter]KAB0629109.1 Rrf2 family transcriptional regulator [Acinetobacter gandensis]OBX29063.1 transcriptional regulator [Acinetobacter gandensis]
MQLNKFTDYALRILLYIARPREQPYNIAEIAEDLQVSRNHLVKIVHFMAKHEWLITTRGKGGGLRLNPQVLDMRLGQIVRILQGDQQIVECNEPPCVLRNQCGLKGILDQALEQFYQRLDQHTLADVIQPTGQSKFTTHSPIQMINL